MNKYVDEHIAFEYPEDYLLSVSSPGQAYSLERGSSCVILTPTDNETLDLWRLQFGKKMRMPRPDTGGDPASPETRYRMDRYTTHGLEGDDFSCELISPKGKLILKDTTLLLTRGGHGLDVRVQDKKDFSRGRFDTVLATVAFPGEKAYEAARQRGSRQKKPETPYTIDLEYFVKFGDPQAKSARTFNVSYDGDDVCEAQQHSVDDFVSNESTMFETVKQAVFHHYRQEQFPILREVIDEEQLPCITTAGDVVPLMQLMEIHVHEPAKDGRVPIGLGFECEWTANGLGICFLGSNIEEIGNYYVA